MCQPLSGHTMQGVSGLMTTFWSSITLFIPLMRKSRIREVKEVVQHHTADEGRATIWIQISLLHSLIYLLHGLSWANLNSSKKYHWCYFAGHPSLPGTKLACRIPNQSQNVKEWKEHWFEWKDHWIETPWRQGPCIFGLSLHAQWRWYGWSSRHTY